MRTTSHVWARIHGAVVHRAQKVQESSDDEGVKREGRRQLQQEWSSFLRQALSLSQEREQGLSRVLQLQFMRNGSWHFHGEPKIRRRTSRHFA